jgi:hypothetical protein
MQKASGKTLKRAGEHGGVGAKVAEGAGEAVAARTREAAHTGMNITRTATHPTPASGTCVRTMQEPEAASSAGSKHLFVLLLCVRVLTWSARSGRQQCVVAMRESKR